MIRIFTAVIHKEDDWYVADCPETGTVSQGKTVEEQNDVVLIPNRAVRLVNGVRVVYVLREGEPVKVEVGLGSSSETYSVLLSGDVKVGEEIILNPQIEFQPGGGPGGGPNFGN